VPLISRRNAPQDVPIAITIFLARPPKFSLFSPQFSPIAIRRARLFQSRHRQKAAGAETRRPRH
jgi:hypothetical protein